MADEVEVEIETSEIAPEVKVGDTPEKKPEIITGEEGAAELKRKLDAETTARQESDRARHAAEARAQQAIAEMESGNLREITTGIDIVKRNLEVAKSNYRTAREKGDVDAELEATEAIAQAKGELIQLEAGKVAQEARPKTQPVTRQDPAEALAATLPAKSAAWVRAHPQVARSQEAYDNMIAAHRIAILKHPAESEGYFKSVESALGYETPSTEQPEKIELEQPMSAASRPAAPAAAPVSRNGAGPGQQRPGTIRLTREQAEIAEMSFPSLVKEKGPAAAHQAYARSMLDAKANGRIN